MAVNPKSLKNLNRSGRSLDWGESKKTREVSVTQTGWDGVRELAKQHGCSGVSELLEKMGRGEINIT